MRVVVRVGDRIRVSQPMLKTIMTAIARGADTVAIATVEFIEDEATGTREVALTLAADAPMKVEP